MHNADAISILNCASDSPCFFTRPENISLNRQTKLNNIHRLRIQACFVFQVAIFELYTPSNDGTIPEEFGSRAEMSVRVRKGGFIVDTLCLFENLKLC